MFKSSMSVSHCPISKFCSQNKKEKVLSHWLCDEGDGLVAMFI